jgi:predicted site-specific integrase-resolvase
MRKMEAPVGTITEKEAAKLLGARPQTMRAWRQRGKGPAFVKPVGRVYYLKEDVLAFLAQSRVVPAGRKARKA